MMKEKKQKIMIIAAIAINNFGDIIFDLFIAWGVSSLTGKFMNAVYIIGTSVAFRAMLAFLMGTIVDKHSKKRLLIISHISSVAIILFLGFAWELVREHILISLIFVLMNDINNEMFSKSYISMTAEIFREREYIKFQSISNVVVRIVSILGAAVAGILIEKIPYNIIFFIDIITYIISLICLFSVNYYEESLDMKKAKQNEKSILKNMIDDIKYTFNNIVKSSYLSTFIVLMFVLNLAYGYIPQILPVFKANIIDSVVALGMIKSAITVGEIVGLLIVNKFARYVSSTFKISMLANGLIIIIVCITKNAFILTISFLLYGLFDSLTQPLFSYTVSKLDNQNRGKLLGGIDAIIMFSPSIGIYTISAIAGYNELLSGFILMLIFLIGYLIVSFDKNINNIVL